MKKLIFGRFACSMVIGILILVFTASIWGSDDNVTEGAKDEWGVMLNGCQVSIQSKKAIFAYCEPIILKIAVRNRGKQPILLIVANPERDCIAIVKTEKGKTAPLTAYGKHLQDILLGGLDHGVQIDSEQKQEYTLLINKIHDMTIRGTYSITIKCFILNQDKKGYTKIISNTIEVEVRGDPPNPFEDSKSE